MDVMMLEDAILGDATVYAKDLRCPECGSDDLKILYDSGLYAATVGCRACGFALLETKVEKQPNIIGMLIE